MKRKDSSKLSDQMKRRVEEPVAPLMEYDGSIGTVISTGSTLLDLAILGGRVRGGGIPGGIFVEIFGPYGSGKTVMLCEIAGAIQQQGGEVMFHDPESRLDMKFASEKLGLDTKAIDYLTPDTIPELFGSVREWKPKNLEKVNGIVADSLAALSTDMEMENKDAYGNRRAKEFSEQLRRTCRILPNNNFLLVCSNQVRESIGETWGPKYISPGGQSIRHYPSLRLQCSVTAKIRKELKIKGSKISQVVATETNVKVEKSSVWTPSKEAPIIIDYDYGVDDIRANLRFLKKVRGDTVYSIGETKLSNSMEGAITAVEENDLENDLREETIDLWEEIEREFKVDRKAKER